MKQRIVTDTVAREFRLLRNRVEAEIKGRAVLLITSATDGDGASLTAYGLAESLSRTHQRTALVTTAAVGHGPVPVGAPLPPPRANSRRAEDRVDAARSVHDGRLSVLAVSHERVTTMSRNDVAEMLEQLREQYDYVVIDGGDLPNSGFGLLFVSSADGVLISFRTGRKQVAGDRVMLDALERSESKVLGLVMNDQVTIDHFTQQDEPVEASEPAPAEPRNEPAAAPAFRRGFSTPIARVGGVLQRIGRA
jgi:Mrp family chromosome partitioning ATPase